MVISEDILVNAGNILYFCLAIMIDVHLNNISTKYHTNIASRIGEFDLVICKMLYSLLFQVRFNTYS